MTNRKPKTSDERRAHWMLGEPEGDWTPDQTILFYYAVILGVLLLLGGLWWLGERVDEVNDRAEINLRYFKALKEIDVPHEVP